MRYFEEERGFSSLATLFGFQDEAAAFVEIDETGAGETSRMTECYGTLEDVLIPAVIGDGRVGPRDFQVVAELGEKECVVGAFSSGRVLPPLNEWIRRHQELGCACSMRV